MAPTGLHPVYSMFLPMIWNEDRTMQHAESCNGVYIVERVEWWYPVELTRPNSIALHHDASACALRQLPPALCPTPSPMKSPADAGRLNHWKAPGAAFPSASFATSWRSRLDTMTRRPATAQRYALTMKPCAVDGAWFQEGRWIAPLPLYTAMSNLVTLKTPWAFLHRHQNGH